MPKYFFIGGHDFDLKSNYIAKQLLSLTKKIKPRILLFPTASNDSLKTIDNFKKEFVGLNYELNIAYLYKYPNLDSMIDSLKNYDIIYFTGGNTFKLVSFLKETGYDQILYEASKINNIIIAGVSAGAMIWCQFGLGDVFSYSDHDRFYNYKKVDTLGILNIGLCPHFNLGDRILYFKEMISDVSDAYALDEDTAILIDNGIVYSFHANKKLSTYVYKRNNNYIMEKLVNKDICILGPKGTFSEVCALKYSELVNEEFNIKYYPSLKKTAVAIDEAGLGIIPFENTLDGYVQESLDYLYKFDYQIIGDISIPVNFAFISKSNDIKKIKKVYVQFKAKGQCLEFINDNNLEVVETESNMTSYDMFKNSGETYSAIVPMHIINRSFPTCIYNVEDKSNNFTRFLVLSKNKKLNENENKCSLILEAKEDKPGILVDTLTLFKATSINLNAIMSRPTKEGLGKYYFYLEFNLNNGIEEIESLIDKIRQKGDFNIKNLGYYKTLEQEK